MLEVLTNELLHAQPEDITTMSLDDIYRQLHHLDVLEQSLTPLPESKDSDENEEKISQVEDDPEITRTKDILHNLHTRQVALRDQAMALSRPSIRALTLLDLPNDLLCKVLDCFRDRSIARGWINPHYCKLSDDHVCHRTIQNVRLVCRLLNDLASPLLCPILRVRLDQESLDRATQLARSPSVAAGIRAILVDLRYYPQELAVDLARFKEFRSAQLGELNRACDWVAEGWELAGCPPNEETYGERPMWMYHEAMDRYHHIRKAWNAYINNDDSDRDQVAGPDRQRTVVYQDLLTRSHEIFRQKHQEQLQLITSQSYAHTLVACLSMIPNVISLAFTGKDPSTKLYEEEPDILRDDKRLAKLMTTSLQWAEMMELNDCQLVPARLLCDLPIAIHRAGLTLRNLSVGPFPLLRDFALLAPDSQVDHTVWTDLRAACRSLRRVSFGDELNTLYFRHSHLAPSDRRYVDEYLRALLSSSELENVRLDMYAFKLHDGRDTLHGLYDMSSMLGATRWPRIRRISIISVALTQEALDAFCAGLGQSTITSLHLASFDLLTGSWAPALDVLRAKLRPQCTVYFMSPTGGEFEALGARKRVNFIDSILNRNYKLPETPTLVKQAEAYLAGADMVNPLRHS